VQFASIEYDDKLKQWRHLVNTLEIYDHLLQHVAHKDTANAVTHYNATSSTKPQVHSHGPEQHVQKIS